MIATGDGHFLLDLGSFINIIRLAGIFLIVLTTALSDSEGGWAQRYRQPTGNIRTGDLEMINYLTGVYIFQTKTFTPLFIISFPLWGLKCFIH